MKKLDIRKVAVLGAGTMGTGLALLFAKASHDVAVYSIPHPTLDQAPALIRANLETMAEASVLAAQEIPAILARISYTTQLEQAVADAGFVIEAVAEKLAVKQDLFGKLDTLCALDTIIASNTSNLNIFSVMPARRLPRTVIAHFFAPAHIIPLVEIVRGDETDDMTVDSVRCLMEQAGRTPMVINRYLPGFCINRLQRAIAEEVCFLLDNGYMSAEDLDLAVKASFIPRAMVLGLVQRYDFTGIDISVQNLKNGDYQPPIPNPEPACLMTLYNKGHYGVKTGKGFYDYSGATLAETLKRRDLALLRVLDSVGDLITTHI